jgi:hypothetical protein
MKELMDIAASDTVAGKGWHSSTIQLDVSTNLWMHWVISVMFWTKRLWMSWEMGECEPLVVGKAVRRVGAAGAKDVVDGEIAVVEAAAVSTLDAAQSEAAELVKELATAAELAGRPRRNMFFF